MFRLPIIDGSSFVDKVSWLSGERWYFFCQLLRGVVELRLGVCLSRVAFEHRYGGGPQVSAWVCPTAAIELAQQRYH
jgi:hypothetical protein